MNNEYNLDANDPDWEARLTALAMDEASDFERAHLESLLDVRPELAAWYEQLKRLHAALSDMDTSVLISSKGTVDDGQGDGVSRCNAEVWMISEDRRQTVLGVIDGNLPNPLRCNVVQVNTESVSPWKRDQLTLWVWGIATVASLFLCATLWLLQRRDPLSIARLGNRSLSAGASTTFEMQDSYEELSLSDSSKNLMREPDVRDQLGELNKELSSDLNSQAVDSFMFGQQVEEPANPRFSDPADRTSAFGSVEFSQDRESSSGGGAQQNIFGRNSSHAPGEHWGFDGVSKPADETTNDRMSTAPILPSAISSPAGPDVNSFSGNKPPHVDEKGSVWFDDLDATRSTAVPLAPVLQEQMLREDSKAIQIGQMPTSGGSIPPESPAPKGAANGRGTEVPEVQLGLPLQEISELHNPLDVFAESVIAQQEQASASQQASGAPSNRHAKRDVQAESQSRLEFRERLNADQPIESKRLKAWSSVDRATGDANELLDSSGRNLETKEMAPTFEGKTAKRKLVPPSEEPAIESKLSAGKGITDYDFGLSSSLFERESLSQLSADPLSRTLLRRGGIAAEGLSELSATRDPFSTFSLHVSDVSFKLAQASFANGQWPDASKIRIEEFVNALDYYDPLPSSDQRVACQIEQAIHPFLLQRNVLRVSLRTAATGRPENVPLRLTLLLDNSGSMERPDRRATIQHAFEALARQLSPNDQVTLISFANTPRLLAERVSGANAAELVQLVKNLPSEGGTNIELALRLAMEKATEAAADESAANSQNRIVMMTDGAVNLGDADPTSLTQIVLQMRDSGIAFDAAGISAKDLNDEILEALTRQGDGRYYLLDAAEGASSDFAEQIAGALRPTAKNVKVQVEFNPDRVEHYKLLGFEKYLLKQEDFRNDKIDAAEMAPAEAGIALYHFEPKPDGRGDVGSVSVRFQDLATGNIVERRWPIPYDPNPARMEQAQARLRLAATAALFAAKLRGDELGESVELKSLADVLSTLPENFESSNRVQQLQSMINAARQMSEK